MTNQLNGSGPSNAYQGATSPATYVNLSQSRQAPVTDRNGSNTSSSGALIKCTVVGPFFSFFIFSVPIREGEEFVAWNGQGDMHYCNVYATCSNPGPYLLNLGKIYVRNAACSPGWDATGTFVKSSNSPTGWWCPAIANFAIPLTAVTRGYCTPL